MAGVNPISALKMSARFSPPCRGGNSCGGKLMQIENGRAKAVELLVEVC